MSDKSHTYHGVRRQTDRLMNDADQVEVLKEEFGYPGAGFRTKEDPGGVPLARYVQTHTNRRQAFAPEEPVSNEEWNAEA
ncbi:MAG: hypothetical protein M3Y56_12135 [Armatimonadota bacterium]|nr:hypothetical protein [Armatimonadota bacterium]